MKSDVLTQRWLTTVAGGLALLVGIGLVGCGGGEEETAEEKPKYEVSEPDTSGEESGEVTSDTLAQLAGVDPDTIAAEQEASSLASGPPPSLSSTELDSQQLTVPEGGVNQIQAFLQQLQRRMGTASTEEEAIELVKLQEQAADRMMAPGVDEVTRVNAILIKLDAMRTLAAFQVPGTDERYIEYCDLLQRDQNPMVVEQGRIRRFEIMSVWFLNRREDTPYDVIKKELTDLVTDKGVTEQTVQVVQEFAQRVFNSDFRDNGPEVLTIIAESFVRSEDEYVSSAGNAFLDQLLMAQLKYDEAREAVFENQPGAAQLVFDLTVRLLTERPPSSFSVYSGSIGARVLELNHHNELALKLYDEIAAIVAQAGDEALTSSTSLASERAKIRLGLVGKSVQVEGDLANGQPFDWNQYAGKAVLVCFWGSTGKWGPALAQFENMDRLYEKYKDKGFEIVGINADETAQEMNFFMTRNPIPWATVVSNDPNSVGENTPMARAFGVDAAPFNFLVGTDGKVIGLHVYDEQLEIEVTSALGLPAPEIIPEANTGPTPGTQPATPPGTELEGSGQPGGAASAGEGETIPGGSGEGNLPPTGQVQTPVVNYVSYVVPRPSTSQEEADAEDNPYVAPAHYSTDDLVDFLLDMEEKPRSLLKRTDLIDAVDDAATRVLADDQAKAAYRRIAALSQLEALHRLAILDVDDYEARLRAAVDGLSQETDKRVVAEVNFFELEGKALAGKTLTGDERTALLNELEAFFKETKLVAKHLRLASATVGIVNSIESEDKEAAAKEREAWFKKFGDMYATSKDRELAAYGKQLAKAPAATSSVVGTAMELAGPTHAGLPFDWESYRGKVVVVDFWATWCGPCIRELPNVLKTHEELQGAGFEVVGVSIDKDLDALTEFLDREQLPWPTLSGDAAQAKAKELGVRAIPTMMLIDQEGNIVKVANRIDQLRPEIDRLMTEAAN